MGKVSRAGTKCRVGGALRGGQPLNVTIATEDGEACRERATTQGGWCDRSGSDDTIQDSRSNPFRATTERVHQFQGQSARDGTCPKEDDQDQRPFALKLPLPFPTQSGMWMGPLIPPSSPAVDRIKEKTSPTSSRTARAVVGPCGSVLGLTVVSSAPALLKSGTTAHATPADTSSSSLASLGRRRRVCSCRE